MKKIIAVLLAFTLILTMLTACSTEQQPEINNSFTEIAAKIGETEYTVADINYMYASVFNNLYSTLSYYYGEAVSTYLDPSKPLDEQEFKEGTSWHDYILEELERSLVYITALYEKAKAENFELPEIYAEQITLLPESLKEAAEEYGADEADYLVALYGEGMDYDTLYKMTEINLLANAYAEEENSKMEASDEEVKALYNENPNFYDTVKFRFFENYYGEDGTLDAESAKKQAEEIATATTSEEFKEKILEAVSEEEKESYAEDEATLISGLSYDGLNIEELRDWLFDGKRVSGETFVMDDSAYQSYIAVMFLDRSSADYNTVAVRHILIQPEKDENGEATEEAWGKAKEKADEIFKTYLDGEKTEEAFAELAKEHSSDGNASTGGIYHGIYKGQMVEEFENWCFDPDRKPSDTGIVETSFGYHIMYFSAYEDSRLHALLDPEVINGKFDTWLEGISTGYSMEKVEAFERVGGMIDDIFATEQARQEALEAETKENAEEENSEGSAE